MRIVRSSDRRTLDALAARDHSRDAAVERQAARIVADVRARGDRALREWTRTLDRRGSRARISLAPLSAAELRRGWEATSPDVRQALELAAANIARVAEKQVPRPFVVNIGPGHRIEQRVQPLARVGCYVPGGRYPLPSTLLMTAVPARAAGVKGIVAVCPSPAPVVLAAALVAGVTELYAVGGAQAIGALAYEFSRGQTVSWSAMFGYKALSVDYSKGSGLSHYEFDMVIHGPIFGVTARF